MRKLDFVGLIFNGVSVIAVMLCAAYQRIFLCAAGAKYVTDLDRAGVFSEERLVAYDPALAENMRYNVGKFITQDLEHAVYVGLVLLGVLVGVNFALFLCRAVPLRTGQPGSP